MSWLKRRRRIGHRLNRFNPPMCHPASYRLPHDAPAGCLSPAPCSALVLLSCRFANSLRPIAPSRLMRLVLFALALLAYSSRSPSPASRVAWRGVLRLAFLPSCVPPIAFACLLAVLRSARSRGAAADALASLLRSVATVAASCFVSPFAPPFVSGGGEMLGGDVGSGAIFFFLCDFCAVGVFLSVLVL